MSLSFSKCKWLPKQIYSLVFSGGCTHCQNPFSAMYPFLVFQQKGSPQIQLKRIIRQLVEVTTKAMYFIQVKLQPPNKNYYKSIQSLFEDRPVICDFLPPNSESLILILRRSSWSRILTDVTFQFAVKSMWHIHTVASNLQMNWQILGYHWYQFPCQCVNHIIPVTVYFGFFQVRTRELQSLDQFFKDHPNLYKT